MEMRDIRDGIKDFICCLNQYYNISIDTLHRALSEILREDDDPALHDVFDWLDELWCRIYIDRDR